MNGNQNSIEENGEMIIDTFPEIPNSIKNLSDGVELTFGTSPDVDPIVDFETEGDDQAKKKEKRPSVKFELVENTKKEEFAIPEKYGEKAQAPENEENSEKQSFGTPGVWTTYVPRFTEASEKFRLGLYRPEADKDKSEPLADEYDEESVQDEQAVDPTAELEEDITEPETATSVSSREPDEPGLQQAKMFKFVPKDEPREEKNEDLSEREPFYQQEEYPAAEQTPLERETQDENDSAHTWDEPFVKTVEYESQNKKYEEPSSDIGDKISDNDRGEYTVFSQRESFIDKIQDSIMSVKIRFFTSAVLALILLVIENLFLFGVNVPSGIGMQSQRGAMAILDLMFVVCLYLLAVPEVIGSFKNLAFKKASPELYLSALLIVNVLYTLSCTVFAGEKYPLVGLVFAFVALCCVGASYFKKSAEYSAFVLASQNGEKRVMDIKHTRDLERENIALDGIVKEHLSKTVRFFRTSFVSGFFKRSEKPSENSRNILLTLAIALGAGAVGGVIAYFFPGGAIAAFSTFALTFSLSLPAFSLLSHKLPYLAVTAELKKENTAIIGEATVLDYANADVITFEDTEVFGEDDVNLQRIMLYGKNENLSKALKQMSALFQKVGGPLDVLFSNSLDRKCPPAYNTFVEEDGVSGEIDFHPVCAGTMDYMLRHRIEIPGEEMKQNAQSSATTRVIYAAEDGVVYAKFFVRYSFSEEFSMILPVLMEQEITPLIYTRDPIISSDFIKTLTAGNDKIRVMKRRTAPSDDNTVYRRVNCGGVVLGDKMNAVTSLLLTKRYAKMSSEISVFELASTSVGAGLGIVLSLASLGALPTLIFAALETLCAAGLFLFTKKKIYISPFGNDGEN